MISAMNILKLAAILISAFGAYHALRHEFRNNEKLTKAGRWAVFLIVIGLVISFALELYNMAHADDARNQIIANLDTAASRLTNQLDSSTLMLGALTNQVKFKADNIRKSLDSQVSRLDSLRKIASIESADLKNTAITAGLISRNLLYINDRPLSKITEYSIITTVRYGNIKERWPWLYDFILKNKNKTNAIGTYVFKYSMEKDSILDSLFKASLESISFNVQIFIRGHKSGVGGMRFYATTEKPIGEQRVDTPIISLSVLGLDSFDITIKRPYLSVERSENCPLLSEVDFLKYINNYNVSIQVYNDNNKENIFAPRIIEMWLKTVSVNGEKLRILDLRKLSSYIGDTDRSRIYEGPLCSLFNRNTFTKAVKIQ